MPPSDAGLALRAVLDPLLTSVGFSAGQGGPEQMIFCAAHDQLSDRYPTLPQSNEQDRGQGCCIDLVIEVDHSGNQFSRVDLENYSVVETLRACGHDTEADDLSAALRASLDEGIPTLAGALRALFQ